jgi:hypothetical protein
VHTRWSSKLIPILSFSAWGWLRGSHRGVRNSILLPLKIQQTSASASDGFNWEVVASWDLRDVVFGERSNASNPNLIIESNIRDKRQMVLDEVSWHYRECAALVNDLARPPADAELEIAWRSRLEEMASYLDFMTGRQVVERTSLETMEYRE